MNYEGVVRYLSGLERYSEGMRKATEDNSLLEKILGRLGNPEKDLDFIHIAGTNGKGSTEAYLENILKASHIPAGSFRTPEFGRYNSVIRFDSEEISDDDFVSCMERVIGAAEDEAISRTEALFAAALLFFKEKGARLCLIKAVRLGLHDTTNVIPSPIITVFTEISQMDFCNHGSTRESDLELAGIIKKGSRVVSAFSQPPEAEVVLRTRCLEEGVPFFGVPQAVLTGFDEENEIQYFRSLKYVFLNSSDESLKLNEIDEREYATSLLGTCQIGNAATAAFTARLLRANGFSISESCIAEGIRTTSWPGSFKVISHEPLVISDGAHNHAGARALADSINTYFPGKRARFVISYKDSNILGSMMLALKGIAKDFSLIRRDDFLYRSGFLTVPRVKFGDLKKYDTVKEAFSDLSEGMSGDDIIVFTGSNKFAVRAADAFKNMASTKTDLYGA